MISIQFDISFDRCDNCDHGDIRPGHSVRVSFAAGPRESNAANPPGEESTVSLALLALLTVHFSDDPDLLRSLYLFSLSHIP